MRRRGSLTSVVGAAALVLALASCGGQERNVDAIRDDGSVDLSKVTLIVGDQKGGSQAVLSAAGLLDDLEYEIDWKEFTSGPPLLEAVAAGSVDIGRVGNTPPLFAIDQGKDVTAVATTEVGAAGDAIVVPGDSDVQSVADLDGARVAVAKGSSAHYHLLAQLEAADLSLDDLEVSYLQPADGLAAFTAGHIDAWAIWDPFTAQVEVEEDARVLTTGEGVVNGLDFQVAADESLDNEATRAAIEDYLTRLSEALVWSGAHRDAWAQVWADETGLSTDVTGWAVERRGFAPVPTDDAVVESEQQMWDAFVDAEQIEGDEVDLADHFSDEFHDQYVATTTAGGTR